METINLDGKKLVVTEGDEIIISFNYNGTKELISKLRDLGRKDILEQIFPNDDIENLS